MQGKVIKIFSDFYYVNTAKGLVECKLREIIKKSGIQICVGDNVTIENITNDFSQAAICEVLPRKNSLQRPSVTNIDQIILVVSLKHPKTSFNNIDRYLTQAKYFGIDIIICVNKSDLIGSDEKEQMNLYKNLGYNVVFTSAIMQNGADELKQYLTGKTSLFSGASGVGKTSLCNLINEKVVLQTGEVSKNTRGAHTTRHCEIITFNINGKNTEIVDTPGFSLLKFDYIKPKEVEKFFPEIQKYSQECRFSDCLHENELDCNVLNNLANIAQSRYESYLSILQDAKEYEKKLKNNGYKTESKTKQINNKNIAKISAKKRSFSRKKSKQMLQIED